MVGPLIADRDFKLSCLFTCAEQPEGVLFAIGDNTNGLAAFALQGVLHLTFNVGQKVQRVLTAPLSLGDHVLELHHLAGGQRRGEGQWFLDGLLVGMQDMSPTFLRIAGEGMDVGLDRKRKVSSLYAGRGVFPFNGLVDHVLIVPGAQAPESLANRPETMAQLD